jgi:uncharacterized protein (TIGR01777 family)
LSARLISRGDRIFDVTRDAGKSANAIEWNTEQGFTNAAKLEGIDAFVHLAGENIATGRWTDAKKARIRQSRVDGTRQVAEALASRERKPSVLICASAIGYYGDRGDSRMTESDPPGEGFLADVCKAWEEAANPARDAGIRVVHLRFGVVISRDGGALPKMLTPFRFGLGGCVGSGRQYWSWISIHDVVGTILHAIDHESLRGPVNTVAPESVTNKEFTKVLGEVMHRPTIFPLPRFVARLAMGEMADDLLLSSTRVVPEKLIESGYQFLYPNLDGALRHELDAAAE